MSFFLLIGKHIYLMCMKYNYAFHTVKNKCAFYFLRSTIVRYMEAQLCFTWKHNRASPRSIKCVFSHSVLHEKGKFIFPIQDESRKNHKPKKHVHIPNMHAQHVVAVVHITWRLSHGSERKGYPLDSSSRGFFRLKAAVRLYK